MTQAFNLALLANAVDTSGKLNVGTNATGTLPLANGGTGTTNTVNSIVAGTGITTSVSGTAVTINASGSGTVTSVATGNGLSGGTITTSGTLTVACPTFNTVGSYALGTFNGNQNTGNGGGTSGTNYSVGLGLTQLSSCSLPDWDQGYGIQAVILAQNNLSGTWKWMSATGNSNVNGGRCCGLICRVS
jgi:hypothetical protein